MWLWVGQVGGAVGGARAVRPVLHLQHIVRVTLLFPINMCGRVALLNSVCSVDASYSQSVCFEAL